MDPRRCIILFFCLKIQAIREKPYPELVAFADPQLFPAGLLKYSDTVEVAFGDLLFYL
jgi:hypothetical protein